MFRTHQFYISLLLTVAVSLLAFVCLENNALAYTFNGNKYSNIGSVNWSKDFITPELDSAFVTGKQDWDATPTKVGFLYNSTSYQVIGKDFYSTTSPYRGVTAIDPNKPEVVYLNWYYLQSDNSTRRRSTAGHELGHALGLGHTANVALMNDTRNRDTIYVPKTEDINGIKALYP